MAKKHHNDSKNNKLVTKRRLISLNTKMDIIKRSEKGERIRDISKMLHLAHSTIRTIINNAQKIKTRVESATNVSALCVTKGRDVRLEKMEQQLTVWIEDKNQHRVPLSSSMIQKKARSLWQNLKGVEDERSPENIYTFKASNGWFSRFMKRVKLRYISVKEKPLSAESIAAEKFVNDLKQIIEMGGYCPKRVFNVDETGIYWKRLPSCIDISGDEKAAPELKTDKDRFTFLLGVNAEGDCKLKPLILYHSEDSKVIKDYSEIDASMMWRFNEKAWVTQLIFQDYIVSYLSPFIKKYCITNNLPNKTLLILNNAPGHPINIEEIVDNIKVVFLPPNTTTILQPMNRGIVSTLKAHYLQRGVKYVVSESEGVNKPTISEVWKNYDIKIAINNISNSWNDITQTTINGAWKKIWPQCVQNSSEFSSITKIEKNIVQLVQDAGFVKIDIDDIVELLDSSDEELINDDLTESDKEFIEEENTSSTSRLLTEKRLSEAFTLIEKGMNILKNCDPSTDRSSKCSRLIKDALNCYSEFYEIKNETEL